MRIYVEDDHNNRCYVEYYGSLGRAQKALDSLRNCWGCVNCRDCEDCTGCINCVNCTDVRGGVNIVATHEAVTA